MISIIVPNYNHLQFLPKRLETIINQSFQDFEIILLDDCSMDGSWEYLKQYENHPKVRHCIRNEVNSGSPFKQWKKGLDLAKYDWVWIAESDDFSDLNFLEKFVSELNENVIFVFCNSNDVDEFGEEYVGFMNFDFPEGSSLFADSFQFQSNFFLQNYLIYRNYIRNASSVLFKKPRQFPKRIEQMQYSGDWFFWISLSNSKGCIKYLNEKLNFYRCHSGSTRVFKGHLNEFKRKTENFECIKLGLNSIPFFSIFLLNLFHYYDDVKSFFNTVHKLGRFSLRAIFPNIPYVFLPLYYFLFVQSIFIKYGEK